MKKSIIIELFIWLIVLSILCGVGVLVHYKFFIKPNLYVIDFEDIDGITKGSPVRFMGINVGYVKSLKSKDKYINVQIIITKKNMAIPNGTQARVEFYGLGGSKSIELMPPDTSCEVGILTEDTIRLNDVVHEAIGIVEIVEMIEKYVSNINEKKVQTFLTEMKSLKGDKIKTMDSQIDNINGNISQKVKVIQQKQDDVIKNIKNVDKNIEKLNQFIKR